MQVEGGAGVGFARGGDVLVGGDAVVCEVGEGVEEGAGEAGKRLVLAQGVGVLVGAGEFDADGKVVAIVAAAKMRDAGVPGAAVDGDVLADVAVAGDVEVRGDLQVGDAVEVGVFVAVGRHVAEKEGVDVVRVVFAGGKADVVEDEGVHGAWAFVLKGAFVMDGGGEPAVGVDVERGFGGHGENVMHS